MLKRGRGVGAKTTERSALWQICIKCPRLSVSYFLDLSKKDDGCFKQPRLGSKETRTGVRHCVWDGIGEKMYEWNVWMKQKEENVCD